MDENNLPLECQNIIGAASSTGKVSQHVLEVGRFAAARSAYEGHGLVLLGCHHVLVGGLTHGVDVGRQVLHLALLEHLPDLLRVDVQVLAGVDGDHGWASVGLYEVIDVSLPQSVEHGALVQISKQ